jgi:hypothetical protein
MTMKTKMLICLCALLGVAAADATRRLTMLPKVRITAKVVDEMGNPISGALVKFVFGESHDAKAIVKVEGLTAEGGLFTGEGYSDGSYGASITKEGFYLSGLGAAPVSEIVDGRWHPWDATYTTTLRPIETPVPLYAKRVQTAVPVLDQPCGYDLEKGDWVAPHGKGVHPDITFKALRDYKDWFSFTVEAVVTFAQPLDGLVRMKSPTYARNSVFRWERSAPESGYAASHTIRFVNRDPRSGKKPEQTFDMTKEYEQGYFVRLRTQEQNGRIVAANYGKITGDIGIDPRDTKTCMILFTYYLNPTSLDRNMEWDPKRNLLPGLSWEETPRDP